MRTILSLKLSLLVIFSSSAQEYFPFPTADAQWNVLIVSTCNNNSPPDTVLARYTINGDTTINEITYKKLCQETGSVEEPTIEGVGGLREKDKKIYFTGKGFTGIETDGEILLYDFTKQIGETINHDSKGTFSSKILEVDSIQIGDHFRKRYKVDNGWLYQNPDYIIEGIGSVNNGLLGHISDIPTCGTHYWEHICYKDQETEIINPNFTSCYSIKRKVSFQEWAPIGAKWYYSSPGSGKCISIESIKDSIVNDLTCKVLEVRYCSNNQLISRELIRQNGDSILYLNNGIFYLLYDFSTIVSDTVKVHSNLFKPTDGFLHTGHPEEINKFEYQILNYDSIIISSQLIVRQQITGLYNHSDWVIAENGKYVINRIGSTCYFFGRIANIIPEETFGQLRCYSDIKMSYKNPDWNYECDTVFTGIQNQKISNNFRVFPNPASDILSVESSYIIKEPLSIRIYDASGKCLRIVSDELSMDRIDIDVSSLPQGIYLIEVNNLWRDRLLIHR